MKIHEAQKVLAMMDKDDEVELHFPNANVTPNFPKLRPMTEGEMAALPMQDPCPGCRPGVVCRTFGCGRLNGWGKASLQILPCEAC